MQRTSPLAAVLEHEHEANALHPHGEDAKRKLSVFSKDTNALDTSPSGHPRKARAKAACCMGIGRPRIHAVEAHEDAPLGKTKRSWRFGWVNE